MTKHKYTLQDAAHVLGITPEALRQRVRRGHYTSTKEANRVYVWLDDDRTMFEHDVQGEFEALISELRARIGLLEGELSEAHTRDREQRRIIAALTQRIPALPSGEEPPSEATGEPTAGTKSGGRVTAPPETQEPSQRRGFWTRLFGS